MSKNTIFTYFTAKKRAYKRERTARAAALLAVRSISGERVLKASARATAASDDNLLSELTLHMESGRTFTFYADYHMTLGLEISDRESGRTIDHNRSESDEQDQ
jgi:hypothetical protein